MTNPNSPLILYHANCADGTASAIVAQAALGVHAEARPVQYGDPIPAWDDALNRDVYVVDFHWPRAELLELQRRAKSLEVFDHHKTAAAELEGLYFATHDTTRAGVRIVWDSFLDVLPVQFRDGFEWIVEFVEDRDLWTWKIPKSRQVSAAIQTLGYGPESFLTWIAFAEQGLAAAITAGEFVEAYRSQEIDGALARARLLDVTLGGYTIQVPVVNVSGKIVSEVVGALAEAFEYAVGWWEQSDGRVVVSLRSTSCDVSAIARVEGGGGHPKAAGLEFPSLRDWLERLDESRPS